jgi:hypothetical protein
MPYTTYKNTLTLRMRDERDTERTRIVTLGGLVVVTDDDANLFNAASKSFVASYVQNNYQKDDALAPEADSEVRDTLRLYFRMPNEDTAFFDIPDPHDDLFLDTVGAGANILKSKTALDAAVDGTPEDAVGQIIDHVLAGEYLIDNQGVAAEAYLEGERITWN